MLLTAQLRHTLDNATGRNNLDWCAAHPGAPQYDTRHTYATMCLMADMNPAFIANQLGHSVQMLLSTYAKWLNSTSDWSELKKLENQQTGTKLVQEK
jgi:integrase